MIFCAGSGKYESSGAGYQKNNQIFNKPVTKEVFKKVKNSLDIKDFKLPVAKWVEKKDMTDDEKKSWSSCDQTGGFLKTFSYKDAWAEMWKDMKLEDKKFITTMVNFDAEIFEKITGIKVEAEDEKKTLLLKKADELIAKANELKDEANNL